ncbi:MAG: FAD-binding oxidoreductase, partial [bacterium]
MQYQQINKTHIQYFESITKVIIDEELKKNYAHDETEDLFFMPEIVLVPSDTIEISNILRYCNENLISVTPRAGGTGLS